MKPEPLQITATRKPPRYEPMFQKSNSLEVCPHTTTSGNSHSRAGACIIPAGGVSLAHFANQAVRLIVNLYSPFRLLGISPPDGADSTAAVSPNKYRAARGRNLLLLSQSPLDDHSPSHSDPCCPIIAIGNHIGFALPYIIVGCIVILVLVEIIRRLI